jgi:hypothetical protein
MGNDKGYKSIGELVSALVGAERALGRGDIGIEGLEQACTDARELYERLVVLRHKAREVLLTTAREPVPSAPVEVPPAGAEPTAAGPAPGIRLDTRPPEAGPRQVSLIEIIEEETTPAAPVTRKAAEPPAEPPQSASKPAPAKSRSTEPPATLAEKLEKAAISDLSKAISLSHKFWFVAELFNGDRITYDKTIARLNTIGDRQAAVQLVESEVVARLGKPADPEALATFLELVQRRYP